MPEAKSGWRHANVDLFFSSLGPCLQVGLGLKWCECDLGIYCMYRCVFVCVW